MTNQERIEYTARAFEMHCRRCARCADDTTDLCDAGMVLLQAFYSVLKDDDIERGQ